MGRLELSRRQVLAALATCGAGGAALACSPGRTPAGRVPATEVAVAASGAHLARRLTFGPSADMLELAAGGVGAFLDDQLDPRADDGPDMAALLAAIDARGNEIAAAQEEGGGGNVNRRRAALETTMLATIARAAWSSRQLHAMLVDFWSDHLHVSIAEQPEVFLLPDYDDVIRTHATGSFADMLVASARSAAMLVYLDQATSRADGVNVPNENYARELMELHTVGVDGGYDEADVREAAHILSGWSIRRGTGEFLYRPARHDLGPLSSGGDVLGFSPRGRGVADGEDFLNHLARLPATATHVCQRLAVRLVGDHVGAEDAVVAEAAAAYGAENTSIAAAVRSIVGSGAFAAAPAVVRRPLDLLVAMLRMGTSMATPAQLDDLVRSLGAVVRTLGQAPWAWPAPNGYPLTGAAWIGPGAMIGRWNTALAGADGFGVLDAAEGTWPGDATNLIETATRLLGRKPTTPLTEALATGSGDAVLARALVFASPEFQER